MQLSQTTRTAHRDNECSETFEWKCNAMRKEVEKHLETLIPQYFTPSRNSGYSKADFVKDFISDLALDVAFDEVRANRDLVNSILLQDD